MPKMIFVNLPVADVERAAGFYAALGATQNPGFSQPGTAAAMVFSDTITVMLLSHAHFAVFAPRAIADARTANEVLICLSEESRAAVDASIERAVAAGGRADLRPKQEMGTVLYGRNIEDLDGHVIELMWMDAEAMTSSQPAA
ncbi:MAG: lactoylglutathione lyase [Actinomycetospora chiangmaiensis]|nr:lactoylglutathione lyase [Actinomycetospora chiangmaiensis]